MRTLPISSRFYIASISSAASHVGIRDAHYMQASARIITSSGLPASSNSTSGLMMRAAFGRIARASLLARQKAEQRLIQPVTSFINATYGHQNCNGWRIQPPFDDGPNDGCIDEVICTIDAIKLAYIKRPKLTCINAHEA